MHSEGIAGLILIVVNLIVSFNGLRSEVFFYTYNFDVDKILVYKEYKRIITSGFLHVSWLHLIFNMVALYAFSGLVEASFGSFRFLIIYFGSLIGGNLFSLLVHRNHGDYSSVGASGAISGIIFASIALFPAMGIGFFFLPISIPSWFFGIVFIGYSMYGIRSKNYNIGHEAHLGGALCGMLIALLFEPAAFIENYLIILIMLVPTSVFIYLIVTRPHLLLVDNLYFKTRKNHYSIDHRYNEERFERQQEVDRILDKISKKGMKSLSRAEKQTLTEYSKTVR